MIRAFCVTVLIIAVAGCERTEKDFLDARHSALMPEPAARQIVATHLGEDWLARPYVMAAPSFICPDKRIYAPISSLRLKPWDRDFQIWRPGDGTQCSRGMSWFKVDEAKRRELTDALVSLGAALDLR